MKLRELNTCTFRALRPQIAATEAQRAARHLILYAEGGLVQRHQSDQSLFCRSVVQQGWLTAGQMSRATRRYHLGMTRDGGVIFWQLGPFGDLLDGKVMYYRADGHRDHSHAPTWVSSELKRFYGYEFQAIHGLFGLHLLASSQTFTATVAVVEAEKTAVIMSEVLPQYVWVATGGLEELTPEKLFPLRGRQTVLFPDTDPQGSTYARWYEQAHRAKRLYGQHIAVSSLLELRATAVQKRRKIDLVDFLFDASTGK